MLPANASFHATINATIMAQRADKKHVSSVVWLARARSCGQDVFLQESQLVSQEGGPSTKGLFIRSLLQGEALHRRTRVLPCASLGRVWTRGQDVFLPESLVWQQESLSHKGALLISMLGLPDVLNPTGDVLQRLSLLFLSCNRANHFTA